MDDPMLEYYERELTFIRESGAGFARKYPKIASRLLLEPDRCEDPHTERILEGFAFLAARIQKKIDDSFPELTESLLQIIYPHYTRPLPSMTTVRFSPALINVPPSGHRISRGTRLSTAPIQNTRLSFKTTQEVRLLPVDVVSAGFTTPLNPGVGARGGIRIKLSTANGFPLEKIEWPNRIRFFLNGHQQHVFTLYEWIMNHCVSVRITPFSEKKGVVRYHEAFDLSPQSIRPAGFDDEDALLPWPQQSFAGYRLLYEYFAFAEKYLYFDIEGIERLRGADGECFEISIFLDRENDDRLHIDSDTFCMYATPAVNLFGQIALPIRVEHKKTQYPVYHDHGTKSTTEVYSIDRVTGRSDKTAENIEYRPFYSVSHYGEEESGHAYWHIRRKPSPRKGDRGMDVFLGFTDDGMAGVHPGCTTLTVHTTCTNRDLPANLSPGGAGRDFFIERECPVTGITCLMKPTKSVRPDPGSRMQWRLISHLSLNYLSLVSENGRGLRELLKLYDIQDSAVTRQQIDGIASVSFEHRTMRIGRGFCRGVEVTVVLNEDKFVGSSVYLFSAVLDRFLAQYVSINAFTRLVVKSMQRSGVIKAWPPRNGNRILI